MTSSAERPVYHCVVVDDSSPGGVYTHLMFAEELPFDIELISLTGVQAERVYEATQDQIAEREEQDGYKPIVLNKYKGTRYQADDDAWVWDGDSVTALTVDSEFARRVFERPNEYLELNADVLEE